MTVMVVGSSGMLGSRLMKLLGSRAAGFDLPDFDVTDPGCVRKTVARVRPDVIINASAITDVDYCEQNPEAAERVHHYGVRNLAVSGVRLVSVSTDQVFNDGRGLYIPESHPAEPVNVYAASKLRGETAALLYQGNAIVRTSWLFGNRGLLPWLIRKLIDSGSVTAVTDQTACVTSVECLAKALAGIACDQSRTGIYHCVNKGAVTPYELACRVRDRIKTGTVVATEWKQLSLPAPRPIWSALGTEREVELPPLEEVMEKCLKEML
jgi:dTDP-4-dehydrorhamnose reductase